MKPEAVGLSASRLTRLDEVMKRRYVDAGRFPGTQLLVYRRGKVVHSAVQGFADVERKAPVMDDTIFRIYSMTKPITSLAAMMLPPPEASPPLQDVIMPPAPSTIGMIATMS